MVLDLIWCKANKIFDTTSVEVILCMFATVIFRSAASFFLLHRTETLALDEDRCLVTNETFWHKVKLFRKHPEAP